MFREGISDCEEGNRVGRLTTFGGLSASESVSAKTFSYSYVTKVSARKIYSPVLRTVF